MKESIYRLHRMISRIASRVWRRPDLFVPAVASIIVFSTTATLKGQASFDAGDDIYHLAAESQLSRLIDQGSDPFGPAGFHLGTQFYRFYQPLFHFIVALAKSFLGVPIVLFHNALVVVSSGMIERVF